MTATSLYRFFDAAGTLLYVGITNHLPRRLGQHGEDKPWFAQASTVTVEHYPDRAAALTAETAAITGERPVYNVHHNQGRAQVAKRGRWGFESVRHGTERRADLWLYPELSGSAMLCDYSEADGAGQFDAYVAWVRRNHPDWLLDGAVPISWFVAGNGVMEAAPLQREKSPAGDFLEYFTWPREVATGAPLNWFSLSVVNDRFPEFAEELGWTPSPLQPSCPLSSILAARGGERP